MPSTTIIMFHGVSKTALLCYVDERSYEIMSLSMVILLLHMETRKRKSDLP